MVVSGEHAVDVELVPCAVVDHDHDVLELVALNAVLGGEGGELVAVLGETDDLLVFDSAQASREVGVSLGTFVEALRAE